mgnify:CR=1 FL=1
MIKQIVSIVLITCSILSFSKVQGQTSDNDPVLFTVGTTPVTVSEFKYIYSKTNGKKADFSQGSLQEYLDLYVKFKLKVQKAKALKLDTIPSLKRELDGYRSQLASSYLLDKEVLNDLAKEAYNRLQEDVGISHIFIARGEDDARALERIEVIEKKINTGKIKFEAAAKEYSEDPATGAEGGYLGYITAFSLKSFYEIESAAYNLEAGDLSKPIRSKYGYHLVKVNNKRPARGEMEAAHIFVPVQQDKSNEAASQKEIRRIYKELQGGMKFADAAGKYSQDKGTKGKGGSLGIISIKNKLDKAFEETIFRLKADGDFSQPFRSSVGWHIVQRVKKRELGSFDQMNRGLKERIKRDSRFQVVQERFGERLKKENNFKEFSNTLETFEAGLDEAFLTYQWKYTKSDVNAPIFSIGNQQTSLGDLVGFLSKSGGSRVRQAQSSTPKKVFASLYKDCVGKRLVQYEEAQLPTKYPDFKSLMREYEEGILLFEATNILVWGKAAKDSVGLKKFYEKNKKNYLWDERVEVTTYQMANEHPTKLKAARKMAKRKNSEKVLAATNQVQNIINATTKTYEKGQDKRVDALKWRKGHVGDNIIEGDAVYFLKVERVIKARSKSFDDARGYVIADYQEFLEKEWIKDLKNEYPVKINKKVFNNLVK